MEKKPNLDEAQDFFSAKRVGDAVILSFKEDILFRTTDLHNRDMLLAYLDRISKNNSIKAIVIISSPDKTGREEYVEFYQELRNPKLDRNAIHRMCNVIDQFILRIVDLNKIVVHANSGKVVSVFLNVSLACDYRIVADNTVFQNPYLELGLVPKGGGPFFLSKKLGISKANEILFFAKDITAHEALRLGIVDKVVPPEKVEEAALEMAHRFGQIPAPTLSGVKKLLNYSMNDLGDYLELENQELLRIIESSNSWE